MKNIFKSNFLHLYVVMLTIFFLSACSKTDPATVYGKLMKNGSAVTAHTVELVNKLEGGGEESFETTTDASGNFRFENILPGEYYLFTTFTFSDKVSCVAEGIGGLAMTATDDSGNPVTFIIFSNSDEPLDIGSGDEIEKDIIVDCP